MRITILMGSPNSEGSTAMLVEQFIKGAEESGHTCEMIDVFEDMGMVLGYVCGTPSMTRRTEYPRQAYQLGRNI